MNLRLTLSLLALSVLTALAGPALTSPADGSILSGPTMDFQWTADDSQVFFWHLAVGSSRGADDYFSRDYAAEARSQTVTDLPVDGSEIFVRLFYMVKIDGSFRVLFTDYTFSAPVPVPPALTGPAPGSVFQEETVTFRWEDRGAQANAWRLQVGATVGGAEYEDQTMDAGTRTLEVEGLPADGSQIWVRLHYFFGNFWRHIDYQYTAKISSVTPVITTPAPGGTVATVPFVIHYSPSLTLVNKWQVQAGTTQGGADILDTGELDAEVQSAVVDSLPEGTTTFWIRLRYEADGVWAAKDFEVAYDPNGDAAPQIFNPPPGNEIVGAQAEFQWTPKSVDVEQWWIYVGRFAGGDSILNQDMETATSVVVNNLPTDGATVYVRLFYRVGTVWNQRDHLFTTRRLPKVTFPAPGTLVGGPEITFEWDDNGVAGNAWALTVGRAKGGGEIFESGTLLGDQRRQSVVLPSSVSGDIWVRLWHLPDSFTWDFVDLLYRVQSPTQPALLDPFPGSSFSGGTRKRFHFGANGTDLAAYWVYVGTSVGARDLFNSGPMDSTETFVDVDIPNEDAVIHVRLWWLIDDTHWQFADYTLRVLEDPTLTE